MKDVNERRERTMWTKGVEKEIDRICVSVAQQSSSNNSAQTLITSASLPHSPAARLLPQSVRIPWIRRPTRTSRVLHHIHSHNLFQNTLPQLPTKKTFQRSLMEPSEQELVETLAEAWEGTIEICGSRQVNEGAEERRPVGEGEKLHRGAATPRFKKKKRPKWFFRKGKSGKEQHGQSAVVACQGEPKARRRGRGRMLAAVSETVQSCFAAITTLMQGLQTL